MSNDASKMTLLQRIFAPTSHVHYLLFCVLTFALNRVSEFFPTWADPLFLLFVVIIFLMLWLADRCRYAAQMALIQIKPKKQVPKPARALILPLSPYDPRDPALTDMEWLSNRIQDLVKKPREAITIEDFQAIGLLKSNMRPMLDAVKYHFEKGRLREVYLLTTATEFLKSGGDSLCVRGSDLAGALLKKYLDWHYQEKFQVHNEDQVPNSWDYLAIWKKAESIFAKSGYKDEAILADITGGNKIMSMAVTAACVGPNRYMQYMDTPRNLTGQPLAEQPSEPILIDLQPVLQ